jgi:putative ABC transport system substrate-binding protein
MTLGRREFIFGVGAATAWPLPVKAQQAVMPVVAFVRSTSLTTAPHLMAAFRQGLKEGSFVDGQNVTVEYHSAEDQPDRLQALVTELASRPVTVIAANGIAALAAKTVTTTIPIVFATGGDPVEQGLVTRLNRPGGNVTGVNFFDGKVGGKRLELLHQLVPKAKVIGAIVNPDTTETETERVDLQTAAQAIGQQLLIADVRSDSGIDAAFAMFVERGIGAIFVGTGAFTFAHREALIRAAARHALPSSHSPREAAVAGALMTYGTSIADAYRQVGNYTARVLTGEKPAELPVIRSTRFEFVINLKTAKTLGIDVPPTLLALADEVIE